MKLSLHYCVLAIGLAACAKNEEPVAAPQPETCSYELDGRATTGSAEAYATIRPQANGSNEDWLFIYLTSSPAGPYKQQEYVSVVYHKLVGTPVTAYQPVIMRLSDANTGKVNVEYTSNLNFTISQIGNSFSGTFSGTSLASGTTPGSQIAKGVFTGAKL